MSKTTSSLDKSGLIFPSFTGLRSDTSQLRRISPVVLIAIVGVVASFIIFGLLRDSESQKANLIFERNANDQWAIIRNTLKSELHVTGTLRSYFNTSASVSRSQFQIFTLPLLTRQASLKALSWIPRVGDQQRQQYEAAARSDGVAEFQTSERENQGKMVPAANRKEYFPVYYIEPMKGNEAAVGFDLASNPRRLAALNRARDTGQQVATAKITLVQETEKQSAFLIFDPVYEDGVKPSSVVERRQKLKGYISAVVRIGDMVETTIQSYSADTQLRITDVTDINSKEVLYQSGGVSPGDSDLRFVKNIAVAGRTWQVAITPSSGQHELRNAPLPWFVLVLSLLLTIALSIYIHLLSRTRDQIRRQVEFKTAALKESENRLEMLVHDLQDANADLRRFAYVASHDLQEPLRKLQQFSAFLEEDCGNEISEQAKYFLDVIRRSSHRMSTLIKDLLSYSRTANRDLELIKIDLAELVDELLSEFDIQNSESNVEINTRSLPIISGDRAAVERLFRNLISNAIKFRAPDQELEINIVGSIQDIDGALELRVNDNGIGFDPELSERILEPFQRLHSKNEYAGSGIGLAICNSICKRHGWKLGIDSEIGKGSTFSVFIPSDVAVQTGG